MIGEKVVIVNDLFKNEKGEIVDIDYIGFYLIQRFFIEIDRGHSDWFDREEFEVLDNED